MSKKLLIISLFTFHFFLFPFLCNAQYTDLLNFNYTNGADPNGGSLILVGNKLYGMTSMGGVPNYDGNIFSIDTNGNNYKDLLDFDGTNGQDPWGSLTFAAGKLYGMTMMGGVGYGNIFSVDTSGNEFKNLYSFNIANAYPTGSLTILGHVLFGMTQGGGANRMGNIFAIDTNGSNYKDLCDFNGTNGGAPRNNLTLIGNKLYGTTEYGGVYDSGCIFSIDTDGTGFKKLFDFNGIYGMYPVDKLTPIGSRLYGMTDEGGADGIGCIFSIDTNGIGYKDLFDFDGTNGKYPAFSSLTIVGRVMYGTAEEGAMYGYGCIFSIDSNGGGYKDLYDFNGTTGEYPNGLIHSKDMLYGMTQKNGGTNTEGVVFSFKDTNISSSISQLTVSSGQCTVYPNPFKGNTNILFNDNEEHIIEIADITGRKLKVMQLSYKQNLINVGDFSSGMYFIKVYNKRYQYITTLKALKE